MKITRLVGLYESNVFILTKGEECLIIDSGVEVERVKNVVGEKKVLGVLLTHGHYDHCFYANDYAKSFSCNIYVHEKGKITMSDSEGICSVNNQIINDFSFFKFFNSEERMILGDFKIDVFYLPGHSHCSCGYLIDGNLFAGDFLFEKSFGRIDLKYSNKKDMISSLIKSENIPYFKLYSGHGNSSKKEEQISHLSLFLKFLTRNY